LALDGDEWSASRPGRFKSSTHRKGGCVRPRVYMDAVAKKKFFALSGIQTPVIHPVPSHYID